MSVITELVSLVTQLDKSITDRKIREHLLPVKEKFLELREEQFRLEQEHTKQISDLKSAHEAEVLDLKTRLKKMEDEATADLEECPFCRRRTFEVVDIQPHPVMDTVGVKVYSYKCSNCQKTTERTLTPSAIEGKPRRR